jgi:hypothetical protein
MHSIGLLNPALPLILFMHARTVCDVVSFSGSLPMPSDDWRSRAAYADLETVPMHSIAWEYLRRNRDYVRSYQQAMRSPSDEAAHLAARRWGMRFPRQPSSFKPGTSHPMGSACDTCGFTICSH